MMLEKKKMIIPWRNRRYRYRDSSSKKVGINHLSLEDIPIKYFKKYLKDNKNLLSLSNNKLLVITRTWFSKTKSYRPSTARFLFRGSIVNMLMQYEFNCSLGFVRNYDFKIIRDAELYSLR